MNAETTVRGGPEAAAGAFGSLTGVSPSGLDAYFDQVSGYALLSREEERELGRRARRGDRDAIEELCQANLRFVISVAKKYQGRGLPLSDLIQQGNVGLVTAATKFDPDRGVKFITYAVWWIRQAILSAIAHQGRSVRLPANRASQLARIRAARGDLRSELGREPTDEEVAERVDARPETVALLESLNAGEVRLDAPLGAEDEGRVAERLIADRETSATETAERHLMHEEIEDALSTLRERDALVLRLYYGLGGEREHTLEEIGQRLGVTRERIRQLRNRALRELRSGEHSTALASFVG